jgi:hypothetical protein
VTERADSAEESNRRRLGDCVDCADASRQRAKINGDSCSLACDESPLGAAHWPTLLLDGATLALDGQ